MTRKVLLTGATGFIGRQALLPLMEAGFEIHSLGRRSIEGLRCHHLDLLDAESIARVVPRVRATHLLHLAWDVTHGRYWSDPGNLDWVAASLALYRAFAEGGGKRVVVSGSCAEYDWSTGILEEDTTALQPSTLYGVAKHSLHQILSRAASEMGIELAWGRVFFLYGPHEFRARLVPSVIVPLLTHEPVLVGECVAFRDFMHVKDVARALVHVLAGSFTGAINIASGESRQMREVVSTIARQFDLESLVRFGARPSPPGEPAKLETSARLLRELGFTPEFTLQAGLSDTIQWWRRNVQLARLGTS